MTKKKIEAKRVPYGIQTIRSETEVNVKSITLVPDEIRKHHYESRIRADGFGLREGGASKFADRLIKK
jgi:hypothetical protein